MRNCDSRHVTGFVELSPTKDAKVIQKNIPIEGHCAPRASGSDKAEEGHVAPAS